MTDYERQLLASVAEDDFDKARTYAKFILQGMKAESTKAFRDKTLDTLLKKTGTDIEVPFNIANLVFVEDSSKFPIDRFLLRDSDREVVNHFLDVISLREELKDRGVLYTPSMLLYGEPGNGKTEIARYIAYATKRPFILINFSNLVTSLLGGTQNNISKIFAFAKQHRCVLCFDELDAIGKSRGSASDVAEMNRIVIALMQELDQLKEDVVLIGTTNRYDVLDKALLRRFSVLHSPTTYTIEDALLLAEKFFLFAKVSSDDLPKFISYVKQGLEGIILSPANIVRVCTEELVDFLIERRNTYVD